MKDKDFSARIERFWSHDATNIRCVREADYDALDQRARAAVDDCISGGQALLRKIADYNVLAERESQLQRALGGMLFAFDDGVGREWSAPLLDYARKLTPAMEFQADKPRPIRFKDLSAADAVAPTTCTWSVTDYVWSSSCGMHSWEFTDGGTPAENGMKFCHRCGKPIEAEVQDDE